RLSVVLQGTLQVMIRNCVHNSAMAPPNITPSIFSESSTCGLFGQCSKTDLKVSSDMS
ncbi:hypothetical protein EC957_009666, partial [Mortierella hygrophila]